MAGEVFQINTGNDVVQINGDVTIQVTVVVLKRLQRSAPRMLKKNKFSVCKK